MPIAAGGRRGEKKGERGTLWAAGEGLPSPVLATSPRGLWYGKAGGSGANAATHCVRGGGRGNPGEHGGSLPGREA